MKKNNIILIVSLLIIYILLCVFLVFIKKDNVVYLGDSTKVIIKNGEIIKEKDNSLMNLKDAKIYFNGEFIDGYIRTKANDIVDYNIREAFNKDNKMLLFSDSLLAYTGNMDIKVGNPTSYNILTNSEKEALLDIAKENSIEGKITESMRVDYDIDNDKKLESVYSYTVLSDTKLSTIVALIKDNENEVIETTSGNSKYPSVKHSNFYKFIDFDGDDNYEIVTYITNGDSSLGNFNIYSYKSGSITEIK